MRTITIICAFLLFCQSSLSQEQFFTQSDTLNKNRKHSVLLAESALFAGATVALSELWYSDFEQGKFHTTNDSKQWMQLDKLGHIYSGYHLSRLAANSMKWSGESKDESILYGSAISLAFLTTIEVFDGFSEEWGFSWSDMASNFLGSGFYVGQEALWGEQRITLKFSFHRTSFAQQRPGVLGEGIAEEFLKDYNGQTYWLSANLNSFIPESNLPQWLNISLGYSAKGMLSGDPQGVGGTYVEQNRRKQLLLSMDIDFTRIATKSSFLRTFFSLINTLKVPFPAVEFNEENGIRLHAIYF